MRIGLLAHGPGTANVVGSLQEELLHRGHNIVGIPFTNYASKVFNVPKLDETDIWELFDDLDIDLLLTGTGSMNKVEKITPILAKKSNIPVISILDSIETKNVHLRYFNEPDYVIVSNEKVKLEVMRNTNILSEKILDLGNPYFDKYENKKKENYTLKEPFKIVYASEPNGNLEVNDTSIRSKETIIKLLEMIKENSLSELWIGVHPRESDFWISEIIKDYKSVYLCESSTMEKIEEIGCCVHIGSTVHLESCLMNIYSYYFHNKEDLIYQLRSGIRESIDINFGSTNRIVNWIESTNWKTYTK